MSATSPRKPVPPENGPEGAAAAAKHFGIEKTEAEMAKILNTPSEGTSPAQIIYGMRKLGLGARKASPPQHALNDIRPPAVPPMDLGEEGGARAVADLGREGITHRILDPVSGFATHTQALFERRWGGHAIEVFGPSTATPES